MSVETALGYNFVYRMGLGLFQEPFGREERLREGVFYAWDIDGVVRE